MTNLLIKVFVKDYKNSSNRRVRDSYGKLASIVGIVTNLLLFIIKIVVGLIFNSIAIIADAINSLSDASSSIITFFGFKISSKPADAQHPYGHARMEYISGLIVSFLILVLGIELIKGAGNKIMNPVAASIGTISIVSLGVSIAIKVWQSVFYAKIGNKINSLALKAAYTDSRNDIVSTSAVLVGIVITYFTGFDLDGYMGMVVAIFIVVSGIKLIIETISPLLGTGPTKEEVDRIYAKILSYNGIVGLHDLIVHKYGEGKTFASVHCEVPAENDIMESHDIIDNIERDFLNEDSIDLVIHLDPIVTNDEKTNRLKRDVERIIEEISPKVSMHDFRVVWGISHSNLIFDVVLPYDLDWDEDELINTIEQKIKSIEESYNCVITIDRDYIPQINR